MPWLECRHTVENAIHGVSVHKALTTIGRATGNDVQLEDGLLQPTHAHIMRQGDVYTLAQMGRAEIYVNGRRCKSAQLSDGDRIQLGAWQITWSTQAPQRDVERGEVPLSAIEAMVELSADMMRDTSPEHLFHAMLEGLVELTRAEKGFVIVMQNGERHVAARHNVDAEGDGSGPAPLSDSIIDQVAEHLKPIILSDAMADRRFGKAKSVVDLKLSSVMCVPLIYRRDLLGVIYLGNDSITDLFTHQTLAMLKLYASQASLIVYHALQLNQLELDNRNLRTRLHASSQGELIGTHTSMRRLFKTLRKVAPTDLSVLVLGETGTGKELVAREVHKLSERRSKPFIAINCGAIPENLLESELFGHAKGSFTGAHQHKIGKIEAADGGTLFLDEIGEMPMNLQVKLLRVLQERTIDRVGDLTPRPVDVRVVAATNRDIKDLIGQGSFREDLYYRLDEITVDLPPLRERGEDVAVLANYFLQHTREHYGRKARGFTNQAMLALKHHRWPGNVRELENRIKKAVIMSDRALLNPDDLGLDAASKREIQPLADAEESFKLEYIQRVLALNNGNKAQTARDLGVDARTVFRYIERIKDAPSS